MLKKILFYYFFFFSFLSFFSFSFYRFTVLLVILTLIFELAVVGLPFLSVFRFSGNRLRMKALQEHV